MAHDPRNVVADLAASLGVADDKLITAWQQLCQMINREYGGVVDAGIGLGQGDIMWEQDGTRYAITITIVKDAHPH